MDKSMLILVSGEGSTDIGVASPGMIGLCPPGKWEPGPMAFFIDRFVEKKFNFSPLECWSMWFINETSLNSISKKIKPMISSKGIFFKKNSQALLAVAYKLGKEKNCNVLPILFRDTDGSQSQQRIILWKNKRDSIAHCINSENIHVCPMVPNPKSEVWLLCPLKKKYESCESLEELSGNDASPNSAKSMLQDCLNNDVSRTSLNELIINGYIDPFQINMPSLIAYREDLETTIYEQEIIKNLPQNLRVEFERVTADIEIE